MSYTMPPNPPMPTSPDGRPQKPDNYLVWAILSTVLCCMPAGVVSIVQAAKVDGLYMAGQYAEAQSASASAKKWAVISAVVTGVGVALYVAFIVVMMLASTSM